MKKSIKALIIFIIGIIISIVINVYSITLIKTDDVSYKDNKDLKSTSDPDYINGIYSSSNTINSNINKLKVKGCFTYSGTTDAYGNLIVIHNKTLGDNNYYPVVMNGSSSNALIPYAIAGVYSNQFTLQLASISGFRLSNPGVVNVTINWCY